MEHRSRRRPGQASWDPLRARSVVDEPLSMAFQVAQEGPTHRLRTAQGEADLAPIREACLVDPPRTDLVRRPADQVIERVELARGGHAHLDQFPEDFGVFA